MIIVSHFPGQDGLLTLASVEGAYRHERETKEAIEKVIQRHSLYQLQDTMDAADDGSDENRLLPAMNRIWLFLVACVRSNNPVVSYLLFFSFVLFLPFSSPFCVITK